jgi:cation transport ATPase
MNAPQSVEQMRTTASPFSGSPASPEMKRPDNDSEHAEQEHGFEWVELIRIAFVAFAAAAVWFRVWEPFPRISVIGIAATLIGGYPIFKEAFENIIERKMTMELSMTIALLSALAIGEFFTALVITGFVLAAEVLEGLTLGRGRRAIQDLLDFLPRTVSVRRNNEVIEIPAESLRLSDTVIVKPGGRIPVDGVVLGGRSFVEQAAITAASAAATGATRREGWSSIHPGTFMAQPVRVEQDTAEALGAEQCLSCHPTAAAAGPRTYFITLPTMATERIPRAL